MCILTYDDSIQYNRNYQVEQCLSTMGQESVSTEPHGVAINTKTIEEISSVTSSQIDQLQQVLLRTIQLEDVEELYKTQQFTKLVDVLKATISESNIRLVFFFSHI